MRKNTYWSPGEMENLSGYSGALIIWIPLNWILFTRYYLMWECTGLLDPSEWHPVKSKSSFCWIFRYQNNFLVMHHTFLFTQDIFDVNFFLCSPQYSVSTGVHSWCNIIYSCTNIYINQRKTSYSKWWIHYSLGIITCISKLSSDT